MADDEERAASDVTRVLRRMRDGDEGAHAELLPLLYDHLRALAASQLRGRAGHTLQPTALVHEAFLKLGGQDPTQWQGRSHFVAVAATAMRQILIDHARRTKSQKRGGDWARVTLSGVDAGETAQDVDVLALHHALERLAELDPRQARVVELRAFGGLTNAEVGEVVGLSERSVEKEWRRVKAWLARELSGPEPAER
ncbi:MAG: sigma-70 family RNA polymerase sigma factor [Myxococcales bacterium]|nr:sigma-70 family RNA polymerase sigma factor [Myxococcales bacterium]MCB9731233.1 sigma-70 family RNA polymerase sigma factor [Deltaproteobacteria bacterium]